LSRVGVFSFPTVFLFTASEEMVDPNSTIPFLEDISSILQNGMVPGLFKGDDRKLITSSIDSSSIKDGQKVSEEHVFEKFTNTIQEHLHIVVCMKNSSESLRTACRTYPSLVTCTSPNWFSLWAEDELKVSLFSFHFLTVQLGCGNKASFYIL
jgi:dynein heavy chain